MRPLFDYYTNAYRFLRVGNLIDQTNNVSAENEEKTKPVQFSGPCVYHHQKLN